MKYKYKKSDTVYMIFGGKLIKGIITNRYKDDDGENIYIVNFRSSNEGLGIVSDFSHIKENVLYYSYQELFSDMVDDLNDRLELKDLRYE